MEKVSFGERLRECRAEKGLTQAQLAARLSVTQSTVGKYERGALQPNLEMLVQLCKVLEVSADYLLGLESETGERMV